MIDSAPSTIRWPIKWLLLIVTVVFATIAPTLTWPQFTGGNENIVVQTALEIRRDNGPVLVPQMMGEPRVKKPPLVAWITAMSLDQQTVDRLSDESLKDDAYVELAWQVRWTGLMAGCVLIAATFALGRAIAGTRVGLMAAMVAATNLLFLKYMRQSTSDVHLAMWVTIANACFATAVGGRRWWIAATLGAAATGVAFLCKGPVALLETVLPLFVFLVITRRIQQTRVIQWGMGTVVFGLVALPWFVYVYLTVPGVWQTWFSEVTREGATDLAPGSPLTYLLIGPLMFPWVVFGVIGCIAIIQNKITRLPLLLILQIVAPLAVMVWFSDRKERYLLPMIGPAAVICGIGVVTWLNNRSSSTKRDRAVLWLHALLLGGGGIALAVIGTQQQTLAGGPWWSAGFAAWTAVASVATIALGIFLHRRWTLAVPVTTFVFMLGLAAVFMHGYRYSRSGMSELKPLADAIRKTSPSTIVHDWSDNGRRVDEELAIYLNGPVTRANPATLTSGLSPQVMILRQPKNTPDPTLPPPWRVLAKTPERKNWWWAFELPSK